MKESLQKSTRLLRRWVEVSLLVVLMVLPLRAQTIFPGLSGSELLDSLRARYKPTSTLGYTPARDVMFGIIDNHNNSVTCVYTGYTVYVPYNDPNAHTTAYQAGLNTEHTWPQSLGATGQAKSDLHHLFPTRIDVNSDRGSLPFDEIPDQLTDRWYRLDYYLTTIPTQYIDEYSELDMGTAFEPREDHKGNVARAMFYFYTMYANQASSSFFYQQKDVLRRWNMMDPVDSAEIQRTQLIASYQDGKPNPFVLDTTLIGRAYFGVTGLSENPESTPPQRFQLVGSFPNPFNGTTRIVFELQLAEVVQLEVFDVQGKKVWHLSPAHFQAGRHEIPLRAEGWSSGVYLVVLKSAQRVTVRKIVLAR